jgi:hypothetical protein
VRNALERIHLGYRIGDDFLGRQARIDDAIHERRVGAVLEQPPHEIGQQIFMRATGAYTRQAYFPHGRALTLSYSSRSHAVQR